MGHTSWQTLMLPLGLIFVKHTPTTIADYAVAVMDSSIRSCAGTAVWQMLVHLDECVCDIECSLATLCSRTCLSSSDSCWHVSAARCCMFCSIFCLKHICTVRFIQIGKIICVIPFLKCLITTLHCYSLS